MTEERFSLKDHLFNREKVAYLGGLLSRGIPGFDREAFEASVMSEMLELELKERIALIARVLGDYLDPDFEVAAAQIEASLPPPLDPTLTDDDFGDFIIAPFGRFVEDKGLEHFDVSMALLKEITKRFSMEGSIRPFIDRYPDETLTRLEAWTQDENYHVRRLVSEGTRPRLPWSGRLSIDIERPLPLLDELHADKTRYVTRSVANHLNDVAKVDPSLVLDRLEKWSELKLQDPTELEWMTRHALRTLIKQGHLGAMRLLGFDPNPQVTADIDIRTPVVSAGESLAFDVRIEASDNERLIVDYAIDFVKKDGGTKPKVFKLKQIEIDAASTVEMTKRHPLRANATTYRLYPGTHRLTVLINGKSMGADSFEVEV